MGDIARDEGRSADNNTVFAQAFLHAGDRYCAATGNPRETCMTHIQALPIGTELVEDYRIARVLGAGGFGITYLAEEAALARSGTIKEYFPTDFAARGDGQDAVPRSQNCSGDYQWGLDRFIDEAQTLAK
ncbi:MAG TPA: hypothetical protein VMX97_16185, partial [Hyphomicrobiaceae bacterium]|nr:hypothetical protein [Hyphomicrobiaceae bacterium]